MSRAYSNYADIIDFTRASTGTYLDSDGLLKTASVNTPRIEYDADGNLLGLLVEESRTNLEVNSLNPSNGTTGLVGATWSESSSVDPSGELSAYTLAPTAVSSSHYKGFSNSIINFASGSAYTYSVILKPVGQQQYVQLGLGFSRFPSSERFAGFDLLNGTVTFEQTNVSAAITNLGNGWYRCSVTATASSSGASGDSYFLILSNSSSASIAPSYVGAVTDGVDSYGFQVEQGSFPTSYIPTSGSTATRSADVASIATSAFGYNQDEGSVVVEASGLSPITGQYVFDIHDNTSSEQIYLRLDSTSIGRGVVIDGGSVVFNADATGSTPSANTFVKYGYAASNNDFAITANGSTPTVDNLGTMPTVTKLTIGGREVSAGYLNGHIKSLKYYPRRLTNAQLQALTS